MDILTVELRQQLADIAFNLAKELAEIRDEEAEHGSDPQHATDPS